MAYLPAVNLPGNASYCFVSRNAAQNFVAGAGASQMTFDTVNSTSGDFVVAPGDDHVGIIANGTYLAIGDVYPTSAPLASGELRVIVNGDEDIYGPTIVCAAALTDNGGAVGFDFIVAHTASVGTPSKVWLKAAQSDSVDRDLSGDLLIIRLPGNSA